MLNIWLSCFFPRFLLQLVSSAPALDHTPVSLNVVETNPFKHLTHLSLKFLPGTDAEIKKFLANCLKCLKVKWKFIVTATKPQCCMYFKHSFHSEYFRSMYQVVCSGLFFLLAQTCHCMQLPGCVLQTCVVPVPLQWTCLLCVLAGREVFASQCSWCAAADALAAALPAHSLCWWAEQLQDLLEPLSLCSALGCRKGRAAAGCEAWWASKDRQL